eukprot:Phypoly_transcript_02484.p1 GENE.Phypoly_transcript_02484~~Phypoly_transcript_02484.p1  ORF type:complete len:482 (+),score=49.37 Phypoly_transcript_02484:107-1552(+)
MSYKGPTVRPVWTPDAQASACSKCFTFFKTLTRKHHCRQCGYIFCNECCATRTTLPHLQYDTPVRVCKCCFDINTCIEQANDSAFDSQILASQGFSLLTDESTSQMRMMEQGCLDILIGCFDPKNIVAAKFLTKAFANLSQNATNRLRMIESSVIEAISPMLPNEDSPVENIEVCLFICNTFEGLACLENNQINTRLVEPHLDTIIRLVNSNDTAIRTSAAGILHNLIQNECTRDTIVNREGHNALISLVLVEEPSLQVTAAKALARLAEDEKYQRKIAQSGALMPLLMQLGSPSVEVQEHAAKALANLAENSENQAKICGAGGIRSLYSLLTSKHPGVLLNITKVLANISSHPASHEGLSDVEVYSALVQVAVSPSIPMLQANAICVIFRISHLYQVLERMRENKVLQDTLRPFAEDPDGGKVHEYASKILAAIQASGGFRVSWRASNVNTVSPGVHRTQSAFLPKMEMRNSTRQSMREV